MERERVKVGKKWLRPCFSCGKPVMGYKCRECQRKNKGLTVSKIRNNKRKREEMIKDVGNNK